MDDIELMNDKEVARIFCMSASWIRGQRFKRKFGYKHYLAVDPVYIGKCPRYMRSDIMYFVNENLHNRNMEG